MLGSGLAESHCPAAQVGFNSQQTVLLRAGSVLSLVLMHCWVCPTVDHPAPLWVQSGQQVSEPALDFGRGVTSQDSARGTMSGRREVVVRGVACLPSSSLARTLANGL